MTTRPDRSNIQSFDGTVRDYNGIGRWSVSGVRERYSQYCKLLKISEGRALQARRIQEGDFVWIYPIMDEVIRGIKENDPACIAIGIDFVEEDSLFVFGKILKSNTARALRYALLTEEQKERLRRRIVSMLLAGVVPREMKEYSKLLRTIGFGKHWPRLEQGVPRDNPYAMQFYNALRISKDAKRDRASRDGPP